MKHLYGGHGLDPARHEPSWWEASAPPLGFDPPPLEGETTADVAIVGAGYTGLSAALTFARLGLDCVVLDRAAIGWGASGRNGGFACKGSAKIGYATMIRRHGLDVTRRFHAIQKESVETVAALLAEEGIDAERAGAGETELAHRPEVMAALAEERDFMAATFGERRVLLAREALRGHGTDGPGFHGGLHDPDGGFGVHPLAYVRGLARAAAGAGARLRPLSEVTAWTREGARHRLVTPRGSVVAGRVVVATNGYTPEDLSPRFAGRVLPALSNVLVTAEMSEETFARHGWTGLALAHDSRDLLHYFRRLPGNRFLFGGRAGLSARPERLAATSAALEARFRALFPAWGEVPIAYRWSGFVCLAADLVPHVGTMPDDPTIAFALAWHGNGVAMGTWSGRAVARLVAGRGGPDCAMIERPPPRFPLPGLRRVALGAAYLGFRLKDR